MHNQDGDLAELLRTMRLRADLTQEELAARSGLSVRAISDLERGRTSRPQRKSVDLLAESLQIEGESFERFRRLARGPRPVPAAQAELIRWMRQVLADDSAARLVELVGGAGTAIAVQAAAQARSHFPDGQFSVDLAAGSSQLVDRLLRIFGAQPLPGADRLARVRSLLRSRRALIVLDNVQDAAQIRPLLTPDCSCAIIVLSRQRIDAVDGAWTIEM